MKLRTIILALLTTLFVPTLSYAYEFEVDGIYYNKNADGETVSVTYNKGNGTDYSGSVTIPSKVTFDGTTYTFGKSDSREHNRHNHIDTGGYGEEHHH